MSRSESHIQIEEQQNKVQSAWSSWYYTRHCLVQSEQRMNTIQHTQYFIRHISSHPCRSLPDSRAAALASLGISVWSICCGIQCIRGAESCSSSLRLIPCLLNSISLGTDTLRNHSAILQRNEGQKLIRQPRRRPSQDGNEP